MSHGILLVFFVLSFFSNYKTQFFLCKGVPCLLFSHATPTCSWYGALKQHFIQKKVSFKEVDVSKDQRTAKDIIRKTGQMGIPVTLINNRPIVGFNKAQINNLLNLK